jgi:hypothetical protein
MNGDNQLKDDPEAENPERAQANRDAAEQQHPDLHPRMEQEIGTGDARHGPGGTDQAT